MRISDRTALVTGSAGSVGSHLVDRLLKRDSDVIADIVSDVLGVGSEYTDDDRRLGDNVPCMRLSIEKLFMPEWEIQPEISKSVRTAAEQLVGEA